jgi:anti-anti-sigma regulatory factor
MSTWRRVPLVGPTGTLRAPGHVAEEIEAEAGAVLLTGLPFGRIGSYARLLCTHLALLGRPWAVEAEVAVPRDRALLRLARRSGCRAFVFGPEPDPLRREVSGQSDDARLRAAAGDLRRLRRAGFLTVLHCALGRRGDDAGVFGRAAWLCRAGRVSFPDLQPAEGRGEMSEEELARGLAWAVRALHTHGAIWRRTGVLGSARQAALVANYRTRRALLATPPALATPAMRLARALARPIRIRERVPFVSTLVDAVQAGSGQMRSAWLRARAMRDDTLKALVIRLDGAIDARAAQKLVTRVRRVMAGTSERLVIDLGGLELVSLTVLTRFLEEHAGYLGDLRGRLAFRNLRPALAAVRRNLHGMLPNAALLEHALEETG